VPATHLAEYAKNVGYVAIFLKAFGVNKLLKKSERQQYGEKMVRARADEELECVYSGVDARFIFKIFRNHYIPCDQLKSVFFNVQVQNEYR
jgi:hypothetical protein